jgi:ketosteroid isomerase-like protein
VSANLDLVRSIYADWERGDFGRADWAHGDIEFVSWVVDIDPDRTEGLAGMASAYRRWLGEWEDFRIAGVDEYRELDDGRVLVVGRLCGRGKVSGAAVDRKFVNVFQLREGRVARLVLYSDRDRALADLGLEE